MTTLNRKPLSLALLAAFSTGYCGVSGGALLNLSPVPLFVTSATKANVLLILDNSNSMDEDATGAAVGSASADSKSEIARNAAKTIVTKYTGQINLGLMAYQQTLTEGDAVRLQQLHNSPYDVSYNPANYNATYSGPRDSSTKRFRIPNPTSTGDFIYYNVVLPFYASSSQGSAFCYSNTSDFDNGSESYPTGPWDWYRCFDQKTGTSDILPTPPGGVPAPNVGMAYTPPTPSAAYLGNPANASETGAGYSSFKYSSYFYSTDSDLAQGVLDFGRFLTWSHVGPSWFSNSNPGRGYLHVPIGNLDATKATALNTKLNTSQFVTNGATNVSLPLQNAGLTPIEGTFNTAKDYFAGNLTAAAQGGPQVAPPNACGKDFVVFLTDGLPSVNATGTALTNPTTAIADAAAAAGKLFTAARPVKSYIVGFALPYGTAPGVLDTIAAAGGTSTAFDAANTATLNSAFSTIFSNIIADSGSAAAVALTSGKVVAGGKIYQGHFNALDWSGNLTAYSTDTNGDIIGVAWNAGTILNSQNYDSGRKIITIKPSTQIGIPFRWPSNPATPGATELDTTQVTALNTNASNVNDGAGQNRLNFIRGQTGISGFRSRLISVLGDIVNSAPAYVGPPNFSYSDTLEAASYNAFQTLYANRTPMIYVGANDGMLHAFDAATGEEKLAYVPSKVYPNLSQLTSTSYTHRYYVDGSPTIVDTFYSGAWHTTLVSGLGAGGQGIFALDVTNPSNFTEANASSIVRWEYTHNDLGYVFDRPKIVKLNTGAWAAVFSNGYNNSEADGSASTTGKASLFIVDIATGNLIKQIIVAGGSTATPNALATPALVDLDSDGDVDFAYAGDLLGNMWKFNLSANNPSSWGVAFGSPSSPQPLFVATDSGGTPQPITSAAEVTRHFSGDGYQLYFGTGKYLEATDIATTSQQTFYSIWDKEISPTTISGRGDLQEQTVTTTVSASGNLYRTTSANPVAWDAPVVAGGTKRGWFMDLPVSGERSVSKSTLYGGRILFTTLIPNSAVCGNGGTGWLMELDAMSGNPLNGPSFDVDGDGDVDANDHLGTPGVFPSGRQSNSIPSAVTVQKDLTNPKKPVRKIGSESAANAAANGSIAPSLTIDLNPPVDTSVRSSWRQIFE